MIFAKDWIWLHVPKCAGTATEAMLRHLYGQDSTVSFDAKKTDNVIWHQTLAKRKTIDPTLQVGERRVVGNIRRLPSWLLSRVHYEIQRSGAGAIISRADLVKGKFSNRIAPGAKPKPTLAADTVIAPFSKEVTHWVRSENLLDDLSKAICFHPDQLAGRESKANRGKIEYVRDISFWFTQPEIDAMYEANPVWATIEKRVYGDLWRVG